MANSSSASLGRSARFATDKYLRSPTSTSAPSARTAAKTRTARSSLAPGTRTMPSAQAQGGSICRGLRIGPSLPSRYPTSLASTTGTSSIIRPVDQTPDNWDATLTIQALLRQRFATRAVAEASTIDTLNDATFSSHVDTRSRRKKVSCSDSYLEARDRAITSGVVATRPGRSRKTTKQSLTTSGPDEDNNEVEFIYTQSEREIVARTVRDANARGEVTELPEQ